MKKCIFCGKEFKELSDEHIIPNAICGRLRTKNLICKDCNSWLGENIDNAFDGIYSQIINFFSIKRDRGEELPSKVENMEDGKVYHYLHNGNYELADVDIKSFFTETGKLEVKIEGPVNKKQIKNKLGRYIYTQKDVLKEKGINYKEAIKKLHLDIDNNWENIVNNTKPFSAGIIKFESDFGGTKVFFPVLKILYFFFKERQNDIKINDFEILEILKNKSNKILDRCFYYSLEKPLFEEIDNEISHFICIKGYSFERKIVGYLKLFSITPFVCILDDNYNGKDFHISYGYKLLSQQSFTPTCNTLDNLDDLKNKFDYETNYEIAAKNIEKDFSRIMDLYYKLNPHKKWSEIQFEVYKKLKEILGKEIVETPYFKSLIEILNQKENYHFTAKATPEIKEKIILELVEIILTFFARDIIQYMNNK